MKKKLLLSFILFTMICLIGVITLNSNNISQNNNKQVNKTPNSKIVEETAEINVNKTIPTTETKSEIAIPTENTEATEELKETEHNKIEFFTIDNQDNKKVLSINGDVFIAKFQSTEKSPLYGNKGRELKVYRTDDGFADLKTDLKTDDLLFASFDVTNNPDTENKITQEQAKNIAEKLISTQCDLSEYTPERSSVSETFGYEFHYSKFIDGYRSSQSIVILITFDGQLSLYNHSKYEFEGIDTNVKIDGEKLENQLREKLINMYGESVEYVIDSQFVGVNSDNKLVMFYIVDILNDGKSRYIEFDMPIN